MNINIKATNTSLTSAIEDYVGKKVAMLQKVISQEDTSASIYVEIGKTTEHHKSGDVFFAEFNLHIAGKNFYARREAGDIYSAIDIVKDDLVDSIIAHKGKRETLFRRGSQSLKNMIRGLPFRKK